MMCVDDIDFFLTLVSASIVVYVMKEMIKVAITYYDTVIRKQLRFKDIYCTSVLGLFLPLLLKGPDFDTLYSSNQDGIIKPKDRRVNRTLIFVLDTLLEDVPQLFLSVVYVFFITASGMSFTSFAVIVKSSVSILLFFASLCAEGFKARKNEKKVEDLHKKQTV
jgi:hypothetical protein